MVPAQLKLSDRGVALLCKLEGYSADRYKDTGGVWTIGYGTIWKDGMPLRVTQEQAIDYLKQAVERTERFVNNSVFVPLTQNQFDALVIFAYNVGIGAFMSSTLLRKLNRGLYEAAAEQFDRWIYDNGKIVDGLKNRRKAEKELFMEA